MPTDLGRYTHAFLRVAAGLLFLQHGLQKLFGLFGGVNGQAVRLDSMLGAAGMIEVVGATLLILGLFARTVAVVLIVEMVTAYFMVHAPRGAWPIQNQGELALLYGTLFVYLAGNGAGPLSIDHTFALHHTADRRRRGERRHPAAA
jgi:putative oxidoreductase